ncbi:hypothetical protein ANO11243_092790 [Dothideomycetidae sp. 11243]|nr:hypothetical protein ANO11243_092790 [fungal sp. No.11243]
MQLLHVFTSLLATLPFAAATPFSRRQTTVPLPANDPFYTPPAGYASTAPGTILRSRTITAAFFGLVPDPVSAWQLLYRTTAVNGSAIAEVTTVFKPANAMLDRFISYTTAYDSSDTACNPSYDYREGAMATNNDESGAEFVVIEGYLVQGYIVASPDYEGPDAAFSAGPLEGMGTLDGMRAVKNFHATLGLTTSDPAIVGTGYSGGAIASGWAAALQPTYAPDLCMRGWALGGTPANLTGTMLTIDNTTFSGFLFAAVDGLASPSAFGATLKPVLDRISTAAGKAALAYSATHCFEDDLDEYPDTSFLSYQFQTLGPKVLQQPAVKKVFDANLLGVKKADTPTAPTLVYHAAMDEIIPYANASSLVQRWCAHGASVQFTTYPVGEHASTLVVAVPQVYAFVASAFAETLATGCSANSIPVNSVNPNALGPALVAVLTKLETMLTTAGTPKQLRMRFRK